MNGAGMNEGIMLKPASEFDETTAVHMLIGGRIAYDPESGCYLIGSQGRRRSGRPRRYTLYIPTCNMHPSGSARGAWHELIRMGFTAQSNAVAIAKANARLWHRFGR